MILVARVVDGRYLALAEGVVERVVDLVTVIPSRAAVSRSILSSIPAPCLLIAVDVFEVRSPPAARPRSSASIRRAPRMSALQRVLILRVAGAAADANVLHCLQKQRGARDRRPFHAAAAQSPRSAEMWRSLSAFNETKTKPELVWPPPVNPTAVSTAGSLLMMVMNCVSFFCINWNEML